MKINSVKSPLFSSNVYDKLDVKYQEKLLKTVEKIFHKFSDKIGIGRFTISYDNRSLYAIKEGKKIELCSSKDKLYVEFKDRVEKVEEYAKHIGMGKKSSQYEKVSKKKNSYKKSDLRKKVAQSILFLLPTFIKAGRYTNSLTKTFDPKSKIATKALHGQEALSGLINLHNLGTLSKAEKAAKKIGDIEGVNDLQCSMHRSAIDLLFIGAWGVSEFTLPVIGTSSAIVVKAAIALVLPYGALMLKIYGLKYFTSNYLRAKEFQKELDTYYKNPKLSEKQRVLGTLNKLKSLIFIDDKEKKTIEKEIDLKFPKISIEKRNAEIIKGCDLLLQKKIAMFNRRSSAKAGHYVFKSVDKLINGIDKPDGIQKATKLIDIVYKENNIERKQQLTLSVISILGIIAIIASIFIMGATIIPGMIGLAAVILSISLVAYNTWKGHKDSEGMVQGIENIIPDIDGFNGAEGYGML